MSIEEKTIYDQIKVLRDENKIEEAGKLKKQLQDYNARLKDYEKKRNQWDEARSMYSTGLIYVLFRIPSTS